MPSRPRQSKVNKPNGSARNRKALSNTAQQEQEHNYAVTNGSSNGHGPIENPSSLDATQLPLPQSSPLPGIDGSDNFNYTTNPSVYPMLMARRYPSAAEVAYSKYGHAVKIDSALSKKVAIEAAKRPPTQRRPDQKLNIERRSNMEAFLAHITGQVAEKACKNCYKGHGPWVECVVYDGQMCGSCTNCWYNASGSRCTFHGTTTPIASVETPAAPPSGVVVEGSDEAGGNNLPYFTTPSKEDDIKPTMNWVTPQNDNESTTSSQTTQLNGPEPLPVPPTAYMGFQPPPPPPPPMVNGLPSMGFIPSDTHQDVAPPMFFTSALTQQLIQQAISDVSRLTRQERHMARIESAAEELALRVVEYNEYLRTPSGLYEMHNHLRRADLGSTMPPGHAHEPCMETMETESVQDSSMS
ncbi:hypothetical protein PWT90_06728 [Aphanocladium album]|nr:hypothetical protein PWT90_06728 [Aphanocladium album]